MNGFVPRFLLLSLLCAIALPGLARAELIGVCSGSNLCAASETGELVRLSQDGSSFPYSSPSTSRDGQVVGYLRAGEPFLGGVRGAGGKSLLETSSGRQLRVSPDGASFVVRSFDSRVGIFGYTLESNLRVGGAIGSRLYSSSSTLGELQRLSGRQVGGGRVGDLRRELQLLRPVNRPLRRQLWRARPRAVPRRLAAAGVFARRQASRLYGRCRHPGGRGRRRGSEGARPELHRRHLGRHCRAATGQLAAAARRAQAVAAYALRLPSGGCAGAVWTLRWPGAAKPLAEFAIPMLAGGSGRQVKATISRPSADLIKQAGVEGLPLKLAGIDGGKRPARVVAAS